MQNPEQQSQNEEIVPIMSDTGHGDLLETSEISLPVVDSSLIEDDIPSDVVLALTNLLKAGESVFVLFRLNVHHRFVLNPEKEEKVPIWAIFTGNRLLLLAVASDGQVYTEEFDQQTTIEYQNGFSKDVMKIAEKSFPTGFREGQRRSFKEAISLFPLPEYEKYLYLADMYLTKNQPESVISFLRKSIELVPTIKAYLLLLSIFSHQRNRKEALSLLNEALEFTEVESLLQELQLLFPDNVELLLYVVAACEERHNWDICIQIYQQLLQKTPDFDLYFLKLGEMYNAKQEYKTAIHYYQKFISLRTASEKFKNGDFICWDMDDLRWFSADPDLVKAYFDLGVIHEYELNDLEKAATLYLGLLRHAPFYTDAYKHFWIVYQQLDRSSTAQFQQPFLHIQAFLQVYTLLAPKNYASIVKTESESSISQMANLIDSSSASLPVSYHKLSEAERERLVHPGELEYLRRIQNWLTTLVVSEEDGAGIEEYCEQVTASNFPELFQTIQQISGFLDLVSPKCFISRGKIGLSVRNKNHPFIFIGSEHLNKENRRYFSTSELVFIIATQEEHIKSGHLLITDSELWKSLGTASFDSFLVALQCLPAGGFLGKLTHHFATAGLKRVYKMTKYSSMQKLFDFFLKSSESPEEEAEFQENGDKENGSKGKKSSEPESLLKEQIVQFARHAVYTADRVGLLACNHVGAACSAIFKLTSQADDEMASIATDGLLAVLDRQDTRGNFLHFEYAKRFSELIKFALSEEYLRLHSRVVIVEGESVEISSLSAEDSSAYHLLKNKLQLLEHSMGNDLLTHEEFIRKQRKLLEQSDFLLAEDIQLVDKLHQAFLDKILTVEELHNKLFHYLDMRQEE